MGVARAARKLRPEEVITDRYHFCGRPGACAVRDGPAWWTWGASPLGSCARYRCGVVDRPRVREDVRNGLPTALVRALGVCDGRVRAVHAR